MDSPQPSPGKSKLMRMFANMSPRSSPGPVPGSPSRKPPITPSSSNAALASPSSLTPTKSPAIGSRPAVPARNSAGPDLSPPNARTESDGAGGALYALPMAGPGKPAPLAYAPRQASLSSFESSSSSESAPAAGSGKDYSPYPTGAHVATSAPAPPGLRSRSGGEESDEESDDEGARDPRVTGTPDTGRASRRRPRLHPHAFGPGAVPVPHGAAFAVAGALHAVAAAHHVRIYDLDAGDAPRASLDGRSVGLAHRELKTTALCWAAAGGGARWLWIGTKEGHVLEYDVLKGVAGGVRLAAHSGHVAHIVRHGGAMVTLDDHGKALVFQPPAGQADGGEVGLLGRVDAARVCGIAEKQSFVGMFGGRLWTSGGHDKDAHGARGPVVCIHNVLAPGGLARSVLPSKPLGAVMCGGAVPSDPGRVYLGHEDGCVSVWSLAGECEDVVKVDASDVLALVGVHDRLWTAGCGGRVSAYDVGASPWVQTASWAAHGEQPITQLVVDVVGVGEGRGLKVVSIGRNERMAFWDGLLGADWFDEKMLKREHEFASFRELEVLVVTWNIDAARPEDLKSASSVDVLHRMLREQPAQPDVIAFGLQEAVPLEDMQGMMKQGASRIIEGKRVRYGADAAFCAQKGDGGTERYHHWHDYLLKVVRLVWPDRPYAVTHAESLVGLFSCVLIRKGERTKVKNIGVSVVSRGLGGRYGNKGGIVCRMTIDDTSLALVNVHLTAGQGKTRSRNADVAAIIEGKALFEESAELADGDAISYVGGGDGSTVLDHEIVIFSGDMNYRVDACREALIAAVDAGEYLHFREHDQLLKEMRTNRGFRLRGFSEGPISFAPTYKYNPASDAYDTSPKMRVPAWCDRVLFRARDARRLRLRKYARHEADASDHRPVTAALCATVKSIRPDARAAARAETAALWRVQEHALVDAAGAFYVRQGALL